MNSLLSFMESEATPLDTEIADFVSRLPAGTDRVGCNYLRFAFERSQPESVSLEDFEAAVSRVAPTSNVYGRLFIEGVDAKEVRRFYLSVFQ
jgi:hypothetical protein